MVEDEWVQAAITDDNVVVEFLVRLKQAQAAPPAPKSAFPTLKWGIRQRRSRPVLFRCDAKRDGDFNVSARGSPTTPLCWSGGSSDTSPSAADGFEETSAHLLRSPPRSKILQGSGSSETNRTSTRRLRRKKTFAELKEENFLLKEKVHLKKVTSEEHRATNDDLKRIRIDLNLVDIAKNSSLIGNETGKVPCLRVPSSSDSTLYDDREKSIFLLPDLNMMPDEDNSGPGTLYSTS